MNFQLDLIVLLFEDLSSLKIYFVGLCYYKTYSFLSNTHMFAMF
jgi:hypothetical protein